MDDMLETMYDAKGIGLAAIQIGVAQRIIVMDISQSWKKMKRLMTTEDVEDDDFDNAVRQARPRFAERRKTALFRQSGDCLGIGRNQ